MRVGSRNGRGDLAKDETAILGLDVLTGQEYQRRPLSFLAEVGTAVFLVNRKLLLPYAKLSIGTTF